MSDKEIIAELREHADEVHAHSTRGAEVMREAAAALETRQPSVIDRDVAIDAIAGGTISVPGGYGVLHGDDAANIVDAIIERAAVPDAATEEPGGELAACLELRAYWRSKAIEARAERDAAVAAVEATRKLHHKITRWGNDMYSISAESYEDDPSSYEDLDPFDLCAECYEVEKLICEECGGDAPIGHRSSWPCPTRAALDGAPEPEWEYGLGNRKDSRDVGHPYPEVHARWLASELEETPAFGPQLMRRRPAGPWLPVEGESK